MLTSKQRSNLKALAANLQPVAQVGKGGVNENMVKSLSDALEARELIKISVLTNCRKRGEGNGRGAREALKADCVAVIGRKVILYRRSSRKEFEHVEF